MIPQRVKLKGFLCYKDEQEIGFDGNATLWMLSGLNGSGKSSIFDAVTFALFGHHRGGGMHNQELINKDSDTLLVEFDFALDGKGYRAKRTLKRDTKGGARGTQQMFRFDPAHNGGGKWLPIEDTGNRDGFNEWIGENIGLNYETFTSSVLLLQGKAEKLLDSKPEGRRAVLASIVDLERYEALHEKADGQRKNIKGNLDLLSQQLAGLAEVKQEEVGEAEQRILAAEAAKDETQKEVDRLIDLEIKAKGWRDLQKRLAGARRRWEEEQRLLGEGEGIERDVERLRVLREVLPRLDEIATCLVDIRQAQRELEGLKKDRQNAERARSERRTALEQEREKLDSLKNLLDTEQAKHKVANGGLHETKRQLDRLEQFERQEAALTLVRDEIRQLPADPDKDVTQARDACDLLVELGRVVPLLERFLRQRDDLRQAMEGEAEAQHSLDEIKARGEKLKEEIERLTPLVGEAKKSLQQANDRVAEARIVVKQVRDSLREATQLEGSTVCRHCGQQLPPGHVEEEKVKRAEQVRQAQVQEQQAKETQQISQENEQRLRNEQGAAEKKRNDARVEYETARGQFTQAKQKIERLRGECRQSYQDLPNEHRIRISPTLPEDWIRTTYPAVEDLDALRAEVDRLPQTRSLRTQAEGVQKKWTELKAKEIAHLNQREELRKELPADHQAVRAKHARLQLEVRSHEQTIEAHKTNLDATEGSIKRSTRDWELAEGKVREYESKLHDQENARKRAETSMQKQLNGLPADWQAAGATVGLADVHQWKSEKADLEAKGTDDRSRGLQQARLNADVRKAELHSLDAQQDEYPPEARSDPALVRERRAEMESLRDKGEKTLRDAIHLRDQLEENREKRKKIGDDFTRLEGEFREQEILTKLLGRDRLQLHLVRQAEKQVVEFANAVLDRLSGGQLYLKLSGEANGEGNAAKALELEAYNRGTGERPINVAFLSGSQKFRVAVSLALGIGQYASRQHRPIESVIIDEGFGCLDSQGRQVMIQELQNLRSQMRCILLVSHQEEFADAFSDGYHFELESGATRVRRIQK